MTIGELISILKDYNQDLTVEIECGCNEAMPETNSIEHVAVAWNGAVLLTGDRVE